MADAHVAGAPAQGCCEFELRNACVAYDFDAPKQRRVILMQANASVHGGWQQVPFPGEFYEGSGSPSTKRSRDAPRATDEAYITGHHPNGDLVAAFGRTWHPPDRLGLVVEISMDNLWHSLFHAIPIRKLFLRRQIDLRAVDLFPRYTMYWPVDNVREHYKDSGLKPVAKWATWELLLRSLIDQRSDVRLRTITAQTQQLIKPRRWQCYHTLVGGHLGWWPSMVGRHHLAARAAQPDVLSFRSAVMRNLRLLGLPPEQRVVFELRSRSRCIVNEQELKQGVGSDPQLRRGVRFVSLAQMPFVEQLRLVGTSVGFAGAHGAGMTMIAFLPSGAGQPTSALEIFPRRMTRQPTHARYDYKRWAIMNNVTYYALDRQPDTTGPDGCEHKDFRACGNMTVDVGAVVGWLKLMLRPLSAVNVE